MSKVLSKKVLIFIIIIVIIILISCILIFQYWWSQQNKIKNEQEYFSSDYNLLIIVSDSFRADALSCYGGEADTPNICGLAKQGVLFENAYSVASWIIPSSISIFTGNYPNLYVKLEPALDLLKLYKDQIITFDDRDQVINLSRVFYKISDKELLMSEILKKNGYDVKYKIEEDLRLFLNCCNQLKGFEELKSYKQLTESEINFIENNTDIKNIGSGYESIYSILDYLLNIKENRFFTLAWISDPHEPYSPPEKFKKSINVDLSKLSKEPEFYSLPFSQINQNLPNFTDYDIYYLKQLYLKEVESVDERIGYILKALEHSGFLDNTFIVFTADHGESFNEHGYFYHGSEDYIYNETLHVPLIITGPTIMKGKKIKENVLSIDLMPTLKDLMGIDYFFGNSDGKSYKSLLISEEKDTKQKVLHLGQSGNIALIENNYKLIINNKKNTVEFYDLLKDTGELNNVAENNQIIVNNMKKKIYQFRIKELIRYVIKNLSNIQDKGKFMNYFIRFIEEEKYNF